VRFNRLLHPDECQWEKDYARKFADFYENQTGKDITDDQVQWMLPESG
jgi:filamentous hemagglutinin